MNLKHIRLRIIDLIDQHGGSFDKCPGCAACKEIEQLRKSLDREPEMKFKHILSKEQDMTKSDIATLLENGVQKKAIQKAIKMNNIDFFNMMVNLGFTRKRKQKEEIEVGKIEMTAEEFVDLKYNQKLSIVQIAKLKGVSDPSVHGWKDRHKEDIQKALNASKSLQVEEKKPKATIISTEAKKSVKSEIKAPESKPIGTAINEALNEAFAEKSAEYERLIAALRIDLNDAHKQLDEKDEKIRNLEHLHDACDDCENEISSLQQAKEELERKLDFAKERYGVLNEDYTTISEQVEILQEENKAMRLLIKKWA